MAFFRPYPALGSGAIGPPRRFWSVYNEHMSRELFNTAGKRLYLTDSERKKFLAAADE